MKQLRVLNVTARRGKFAFVINDSLCTSHDLEAIKILAASEGYRQICIKTPVGYQLLKLSYSKEKGTARWYTEPTKVDPVPYLSDLPKVKPVPNFLDNPYKNISVAIVAFGAGLAMVGLPLLFILMLQVMEVIGN